MHLAVELDGAGAHPAAWRRAAHAPNQLLTPRRVRDTARIAENAGFALITLADDVLPPGTGPDPVGRIGAVERAAFIAAATSVIAVAPVISTTYAEPFHVSSQLASLDHISVGRAGWLVATSPSPQAARVWGRPAVDDVEREARDSVRVARDLWDSWDDDAVVRDVATSRYLDRDRLHYIDFVGETFSVKGPAIVPRPPQGQVVVFAPDGLLPADQVDVALVSRNDLDAVREASARVRSPRTFAEIEVALDIPGTTATERLADLGPWPETERLRYVGGVDGFIELLTEASALVDGVRIHPLVLDEDIAVLSQLVVPALLGRAVVSRPVAGSSLRTTLGLARPANRYATTSGETR